MSDSQQQDDSKSNKSKIDTIVEEENSLKRNLILNNIETNINISNIHSSQINIDNNLATNFNLYQNNTNENQTIIRQKTNKTAYLGKVKKLFKHHLRNVTYIPYLTPEKKASLILQLKKAKDKVLQKQAEYLNSIKVAIRLNDIEAIKDLMLSKSNKEFYQLQLQNSPFLSQMLIENKVEMLQLVLSDLYYQFDELFIFTYLCGELNKKDQKMKSNELEDIIENVINMKLYKMSLIKVLAWLICCFDYYPLLNLLVQKNQKEFYDEEAMFNGFLSQSDVIEYYNDIINFNQIINVCLKENCEQYAIELVRYKNQLNSDEVINTAIKTNSRLFLKFLWEKCSKGNTGEGETETERNRDRDRNKGKEGQSKETEITKKNPSQKYNNYNNAVPFNNGVIVYYISSIILQINSLLTNRDFIYDIITGWSYLNKDALLLKTLFKIKAYDEISILLFRYPHNSDWKFTQDDCLKIIYNKGIQLTLHCLTLKACIKVLEKSMTQKFIVENYLE